MAQACILPGQCIYQNFPVYRIFTSLFNCTGDSAGIGSEIIEWPGIRMPAEIICNQAGKIPGFFIRHIRINVSQIVLFSVQSYSEDLITASKQQYLVVIDRMEFFITIIRNGKKFIFSVSNE